MTDLINPALAHNADDHARRFAAARPFRHVVIDDFFRAEAAQALLTEFPPFDAKFALNEAGEVGNKAVVEKIRGIGPTYSALDDLIQKQTFLELIGKITGIPGLQYDPWYFGGGTHENRHGQDLDPHIDFNRHPIDRSHRRLNLIVYLNPEWNDAWGGSLELHRDPRARDNQVELVTPLFNRCVIFETTEHSWHGFSRIAVPSDHATLTRKSIALYFYTAERPDPELADTHSTIYVDRPLPPNLSAGHVLADTDIEALRVLMARRDQHIQRLYRDIAQLQKRHEQLQSLVASGRIGRAIHLFRRAIALLRR